MKDDIESKDVNSSSSAEIEEQQEPGAGVDSDQSEGQGGPREEAEKGVPAAGPKEPSRGGGRKGERTLMVRYGRMGLIGQFRHSEREIPAGVKYVIIKTERGMEVGEILSPFYHSRGCFPKDCGQVEQYCHDSGENYPFTCHGTVVRFATEMDLKDQHHLDANVKQELKRCQDMVDEAGLSMHLVDAEHLFGGERIIFYFMAEGRVDFRGLVKDLAHHYQTRIEMRQIGARDEARLVADFETCGRECCCKNFLKVLHPVNMRMAKLQKATLDPTKISGRCGRLKCCLRYEDEVYMDLYKRLPYKNSCVLTEQGHGIVEDTQVLTQLLKVRLAQTGQVAVVRMDELLEKNYTPPVKPVGTESAESDEQNRGRGRGGTQRGGRPTEKDRKETKERKESQEKSQGPGGDGKEVQEKQGESDKRRSGRGRRRRRKKRKPSGDGGGGGQSEKN